ncbi:transmembrane protein 59 [Corythoichthys intestinalis]|uniref:transmembrane protein 59 n=1 Tax=Corythoichthys intestinalis TaxID=161448 RepID=UPI0025A500A5|nr:transmembrane protein 59 [Corythoichthys intestinalis]XP_061795715.1 transmembrane protein 59-like [Nerophis lumbriciformis]
MGSVSGFVLFFGLFGTMAAASSDVFDSVLGSTASCHRSCEMTYTLHTYPREDELYACQRGCRLFSICQFVRDSKDLNRTANDCQSTCHEAYAQVNEQYACNLGCNNQLPFAEQRHEQLEAMMPRIHMLHPLMLVRGLWEDMINQAHTFITSTWTFYVQADDGKVVVFQFETEKDEEDQEVQNTFPDASIPIYKDYQRTLIQERDRDMSAERGDDNYDFFSCIARNPWLPGWFLTTTTLVLSVMVLIWICCASVATAVDQYVPAEKLSICSDKYLMAEQKLIPYPSSSLLVIKSKGLGEDDEVAGPLPSKVNLGQSDI